jgi:hypothetical protein
MARKWRVARRAACARPTRACAARAMTPLQRAARALCAPHALAPVLTRALRAVTHRTRGVLSARAFSAPLPLIVCPGAAATSRHGARVFNCSPRATCSAAPSRRAARGCCAGVRGAARCGGAGPDADSASLPAHAAAHLDLRAQLGCREVLVGRRPPVGPRARAGHRQRRQRMSHGHRDDVRLRQRRYAAVQHPRTVHGVR